MYVLVVTHLFGCLDIEIIALFLPCTKETEPGARCLALKPLVSHLRYASQVIPIRSQYLFPGNYRPFKDIQGNTVTYGKDRSKCRNTSDESPRRSRKVASPHTWPVCAKIAKIRGGGEIGTTPIPGEHFCWDFFERNHKMTGISAELDQ